MKVPLDGCGSLEVHEVWAWNLDAEFDLLEAVAAEQAGVVLALDTEFPGLLLQERMADADVERYQIFRENVNTLRLIQLGVALAGADGVPRGAWSFNLQFDVAVDLHSEPSVELLRTAGVDFERHAAEGVRADALSWRLASSPFLGWGSICRVPFWEHAPLWVTFSGDYDLGFLLKLLRGGRQLPTTLRGFGLEIDAYCPWRLELRNQLPRGSLETLARSCGLRRLGAAHTAGSDALLTLGLYLHLCLNASGSWECCDPWELGPAVCWPQNCGTDVVSSQDRLAKSEATHSDAKSRSPSGKYWVEELNKARSRADAKVTASSRGPLRARQPPDLVSFRMKVPTGQEQEVGDGPLIPLLFAFPPQLAHRLMLCSMHSVLLSIVFPPSLDTLLFLPLQVVIILTLVFSGAVPAPPRYFLSAYLAGCCTRLAAVVLCWAVQGRSS